MAQTAGASELWNATDESPPPPLISSSRIQPRSRKLRYGPQKTTPRPVSKLFALCPAYPQTPWVCYLVLPISSSHLHSSSGLDPASTRLRREVGSPSLSAILSITP
ncbi:hypothetical protein CABS02_00655 [Colletotrichum abscissum]|uniref:Uncharacterized protein n=1 Tax=Colletotrichum abscissum TaxID=1671311 RepID=A0A9Q0B787_9PEZI|nr:hypothetical protein CABS02_00655 [Colletotrichum abscissum]